MATRGKPEKSSDSEYYTKAVLWILVGIGVVVGGLVILFRLSGTLH